MPGLLSIAQAALRIAVAFERIATAAERAAAAYATGNKETKP